MKQTAQRPAEARSQAAASELETAYQIHTLVQMITARLFPPVTH
jgi:hypothetical protein